MNKRIFTPHSHAKDIKAKVYENILLKIILQLRNWKLFGLTRQQFISILHRDEEA